MLGLEWLNNGYVTYGIDKPTITCHLAYANDKHGQNLS